MRLGLMIAIEFAFLVIGIALVHCMIAHVIASVFSPIMLHIHYPCG